MISIHKVLQVFEKWFWQLWRNPTLKCKLWPLVYRLETTLSAIICLSTCRDWRIYFWGLSNLATLCGTSTGNQFCHPCCLTGREGCGRQRCLYTPCSVAPVGETPPRCDQNIEEQYWHIKYDNGANINLMIQEFCFSLVGKFSLIIEYFKVSCIKTV